jgi:Uma2 family endonuclease
MGRRYAVSIAPAEKLMTAEEFLLLPDDGVPKELVRGRVITLNVPTSRHGQICAKIAQFVGNFADEQNLGHVVCNERGVVTERNPDTIRRADVAFYTYRRAPPELIVEVRSPGDSGVRLLRKAGEFLEAGVRTVCLLDEQTGRVAIYSSDDPPQDIGVAGTLTFPDLLPGFEVRVERFFA